MTDNHVKIIGFCQNSKSFICASINKHDGFALSMKDDMEMIAYTLLLLKYGKNPWFDENVLTNENEQNSIIYSKKRLLIKD